VVVPDEALLTLQLEGCGIPVEVVQCFSLFRMEREVEMTSVGGNGGRVEHDEFHPPQPPPGITAVDPAVRIFNVNDVGVINRHDCLLRASCQGPVNKCKLSSCISCTSKHEARLLLGLSPKGPVPGQFSEVALQIQYEMEDESDFVNILEDPRFEELRRIAGAREEGDVLSMLSWVTDSRLVDLCKATLTDLIFFLFTKEPLGRTCHHSSAMLIGAAHAFRRHTVDTNMLMLGEMVTKLKRKLDGDGAHPNARTSPFKVSKPNFGLMDTESADF